MLVNIREKKKKRILSPKPFQFFFELLIHSSTVLKFLVFTGRYDLQTRSLTKHLATDDLKRRCCNYAKNSGSLPIFAQPKFGLVLKKEALSNLSSLQYSIS